MSIEKEKLIRSEIEQHEKLLADIEKVDDRFLEILNITASVFSGVILTKDVRSLKEMYEVLSSARKICDFTLDSYWVPWTDHVCVSFKSKSSCPIRFSVEGNHDETMAEFTKGKCRVVTVPSYSVLCENKS